MSEFQKPLNYMNKEGETCFVKKKEEKKRNVFFSFFSLNLSNVTV